MKDKIRSRFETEGLKALKTLFPDSEAVFSKASEIMILKSDRCICDVPVNSYYVRVPDEYKFRCTRCRLVVSPLSVTPLSRQHKDLTVTVDLALRLFYSKRQRPISEIARIYGCSRDTARDINRRVIEWMELSLRDSETPLQPKHIIDTKIIKVFAERHNNLTSAVDSLFNALPSLRVAMKRNSNNH